MAGLTSSRCAASGLLRKAEERRCPARQRRGGSARHGLSLRCENHEHADSHQPGACGRPSGLCPGDDGRNMGADGVPLRIRRLPGRIPRQRSRCNAGGRDGHHAHHREPHPPAYLPSRSRHAEDGAGVRRELLCGRPGRPPGPPVGGRIRHLRHPAPLRGGVRGRRRTADADDDLHVPAVPVAAVSERARAAGGRALPGRRGPGGSDLAVPPSAGPQCRSLQPGRGGAVVVRRAGGAGDTAGARAGHPWLGHAGGPQACPVHHGPGVHPGAPG